MKESKLTLFAVWAYLVAAVLAEIGLFYSSPVLLETRVVTVRSAILFLASTQVTVVALFYMRIKYETRYLGFIVAGCTILGLVVLALFLWGVSGVPAPHVHA